MDFSPEGDDFALLVLFERSSGIEKWLRQRMNGGQHGTALSTWIFTDKNILTPYFSTINQNWPNILYRLKPVCCQNTAMVSGAKHCLAFACHFSGHQNKKHRKERWFFHVLSNQFCPSFCWQRLLFLLPPIHTFSDRPSSLGTWWPMALWFCATQVLFKEKGAQLSCVVLNVFLFGAVVTLNENQRHLMC